MLQLCLYALFIFCSLPFLSHEIDGREIAIGYGSDIQCMFIEEKIYGEHFSVPHIEEKLPCWKGSGGLELSIATT